MVVLMLSVDIIDVSTLCVCSAVALVAVILACVCNQQSLPCRLQTQNSEVIGFYDTTYCPA